MNFMTRTFSILMIFILNILKLMNFRKTKPDIFEILWPVVVLQLRENPASPPFSSACPPPPTVVQGFTVTCTHTSVSPVSSNCYFTLPPPPPPIPHPRPATPTPYWTSIYADFVLIYCRIGLILGYIFQKLIFFFSSEFFSLSDRLSINLMLAPCWQLTLSTFLLLFLILSIIL